MDGEREGVTNSMAEKEAGSRIPEVQEAQYDSEEDMFANSDDNANDIEGQPIGDFMSKTVRQNCLKYILEKSKRAAREYEEKEKKNTET